MGFYCQIYIASRISQKDGKPVTPDITVPEEYRRFLDEKGPWYRAYMRDDNYHDSTALVYDQFPTWKKVQDEFPEETSSKYGWTKEDHDLFEKAIEWFSNQRIRFVVEWG